MRILTREMYEETLVLHADADDITYPFIEWKRDARDFYILYMTDILVDADCHDAFTKTAYIDVYPHSLRANGQEGYKGVYSLPEGFFSMVESEIKYGSDCSEPLIKEVDKPASACGCSSNNWEDDCNTCGKCRSECCKTYSLSGDCLELRWLPCKNGQIWMRYLGFDADFSNIDGYVDMPHGLMLLIQNHSARRFMQRRHGGKYHQTDEIKDNTEEISLWKKQMMKEINYSCRSGKENTVVPIKTT